MKSRLFVLVLSAIILATPFLQVLYATKYSAKWSTPLVGDCSQLNGSITAGAEVLGGILYDKDGNNIGGVGSLSCSASSLINTFAKPYSWQMGDVLVYGTTGIVASCLGATGVGFPGSVTCDAGSYGKVTFTFLRPGH